MTKETYPDGQVVSYEYGKSGERTSITYPDGSTAHYRYDNKHRLAEIMDEESSILYHYDNLNRLASVLCLMAAAHPMNTITLVDCRC